MSTSLNDLPESESEKDKRELTFLLKLGRPGKPIVYLERTVPVS